TESLDDDLAGLQDTLLSVFYHELTHAITMNIRTPAWQIAADIFGDFMSASMINMPPSFREGAAVFSESTSGAGRLNDPFTAQVPAQAKYENRFPSWKEASGASDLFTPASLPYLYGAAFNRWMAEEYGMEQYNRFLAETGAGHFYFVAGIYKKIYGASLIDDWERFRESVQVPASVTEPEILPIKAGLFSSIAARGSGIAWIDMISSGVYFWNPDTPDKKPQKLFSTQSTAHRLSFSPEGKSSPEGERSPEGRYLLVSTARAVPPGFEWRLRVYDTEERRFTGFSGERLRDGSFVTLADGSLAIAAVETSPQGNSLVVLRFDGGEGAEEGEGEELFRLKMAANHIPVNPSDGGSGTIAFIDALGMDRRLLFWDPQTGALEEAVFAEGTPAAMRCLSSSYQDGRTLLAFGWSELDTFYRLGILDRSDSSVSLQQGDLSGGVLLPVRYGNAYYYAARFALSEELCRFPVSADGTGTGFGTNFGTETVFSRSSFSLEPASIYEGAEVVSSFSTNSELRTPEKYRPASYFSQGMFIPIIGLDFFSDPITWGLGASWMTADPAEKWNLTASLYYHMPPMFFDVSLDLINTSHPLNWEAVLSDFLVTENGNALRSTQGIFNTSITFPLKDYAKSWTLNTSVYVVMESETASVQDVRLFGAYTLAPAFAEAGLVLSPGFSFARRTGTGPFDRIGFNTFLLGMVDLPFYKKDSISGEGAFGVSPSEMPVLGEYVFSFTLPGLLPVRNPRGFTLRLPLTLTLSTAWALNGYIGVDTELSSLVPFAESVSRYAETKGRTVSGVNASVVLFAAEIQKGIPLIPFVANRVVLSGGYHGSYYSNYDFTEGTWLDSVSGKLALIVSPAIGSATGFQLSLDLEMAWFPRTNDIRGAISGLYRF
ncbi:MAG: hypothetical protein LBU99_01195, partial [Spirochaetaceae bacterium]|nr:hypothetical protein [Spirochaetaceae bacterium]